ncbi:MAG: pyridoxal phosphate-dependent aminotransferase [Acidobacteriota bacterium]|nr:pyridoxal phosphate-dependent aminotransferase [Acidobacteriota bacterium]
MEPKAMSIKSQPNNTGDIDAMLSRGVSRRAFGRIFALATAGAALPFYNEASMAHAQLSNIGRLPPGAVKINANENPMGPCPEALEAIYKIAKNGGRYLYEETETFVDTIAQQEGVKPAYVLPFAGSSDPLHRSVIAFTSPTKSFVMSDPGYEAGGRAAKFIGAKIHKLPLAKDYSHDVRAMVKADPNAGVIYICNPNNPTGNLTSRADIEYTLANKPKNSILLLDEAYLHFSDATPCTDLVAADKDIIILRTFSKLYGMAGIRAGCAIGRPDLIAKLEGYGAGALPVTGMAAATASLNSKTLIPERRKLIKEIREDVFGFLQKHNFSFVPSDSNCFMLDAKRPAGELISAMAKEKIYIGRVWPVWPTHTRITVGTREEMAKFKAALLKVKNS